ncbi:MAG: PhzF family phenazine biosynthesis protein [Chloroflexi bacterium]|nr:PhzF family phenazine biosynthesis protein [Chloroflexota bacterium]
MKRFRVLYLDAFTTQPFAGNPCAVLPEAEGLSDEQMQAIARETNLSETAFVLPSTQADFRVRYFMPRREIPFAGHPTIATAFALAQEGRIALGAPSTTVQLEFNVGVLPVEVQSEGRQPRRVVMTQQPPTFGPTFSREEVAPCLGLTPADLHREVQPQVVGTGVPFLLALGRDLRSLEQVAMDRPALAALCQKAGVSAAFLFCLGGYSPEADTHARLLDPRGASEDPFTGSASGAMGAYLVRYSLRTGPRLLAEQGHFVGRPGLGVLEIEGNAQQITAVRLGGAAVRTLEGEVLTP